MNANEDQEFTNRRFSLPHSLNDALQNLANQHYQGNVSLFLRGAIEDHRITLEGKADSELSYKKLLQELESQAELLGEVHSKSAQFNRAFETYTERRSRYLRGTFAGKESANRRVFQAVLEADGLRLADLDDLLDLPMSKIHSAVAELTDSGLIRYESQRCYPTGRSPTGSTDDA